MSIEESIILIRQFAVWVAIGFFVILLFIIAAWRGWIIKFWDRNEFEIDGDYGYYTYPIMFHDKYIISEEAKKDAPCGSKLVYSKYRMWMAMGCFNIYSVIRTFFKYQFTLNPFYFLGRMIGFIGRSIKRGIAHSNGR